MQRSRAQGPFDLLMNGEGTLHSRRVAFHTHTCLTGRGEKQNKTPLPSHERPFLSGWSYLAAALLGRLLEIRDHWVLLYSKNFRAGLE